MKIDEFAPQLSYFFYTYQDIFEEAAKYRAGRRMWARLVKERWGAKSSRSLAFRFGVACGGASLAAADPLNNVVRVAYQVLAAALGGAQSIFSCAYDEAYALPTAESTSLALRTQQICAEEGGLINTVDPLGGSYYVEGLTDAMEAAAKKIMDEIEKLGGMVSCIEKGIIQKWISDEAYKTEIALQGGKKVWVGVNKYASASAPPLSLHQHNVESARRKLKELKELKAGRDNARVQNTLTELTAAAEKSGQNLMPLILAAVKAYATVGEINQAMKKVFGEFKEPTFV
jgi:methylmalonyl-CoA mutase N-terminal domain/subunit